MKRIMMLLLAGITLATVVSCKSGGPEGAAKHFFEAIQAKNFAEAKKYATKESQSLLDMLSTFAKNAPDSSQSKTKESFDVVNVKVNGDNATADIVSKDKKAPVSISLKKEDGAWKVAFDKTAIMKMAMESKGAINHTEQPPFAADSLKVGVDSAVLSDSSSNVLIDSAVAVPHH